jgi:hypothetical protein
MDKLRAQARIERLSIPEPNSDWHDLAARLRAPVTQSPNADWRRDARFCFENADLLNEREWDFIVTIARGRKSLTDKQLNWLRDIADRLRSAT